MPGSLCADKSPTGENLTGWESRTARGQGHKRQKPTGFTLTEVIIASTLLVLAMVPILKALTSAIASSTIIERRTRSLVLGQATLEQIKARSIYSYDEDFTASNLSVDGLYLCNVADSAQSSDLRVISVSVGYDENGNNTLETGEIEIRLATLLARRW